MQYFTFKQNIILQKLQRVNQAHKKKKRKKESTESNSPVRCWQSLIQYSFISSLRADSALLIETLGLYLVLFCRNCYIIISHRQKYYFHLCPWKSDLQTGLEMCETKQYPPHYLWYRYLGCINHDVYSEETDTRKEQIWLLYNTLWKHIG